MCPCGGGYLSVVCLHREMICPPAPAPLTAINKREISSWVIESRWRVKRGGSGSGMS